jgi:hypothetical protein
LRNANHELSLERSKHSVEVVVKDEDIRKLRVAQCLLQDDNSDLHEQLEEEQARADELEKALDEALTQLDEQQAEGEAARNTIRTQAREVANLKVGPSGLSMEALLTLTRLNYGPWKTPPLTLTKSFLTSLLCRANFHHYDPKSNTYVPRSNRTQDCSPRSSHYNAK